ncbi:hypothetical protein RRG08_019657 [Elysia crispata]|uniref:Uncharacterized protein n=1 Tax=Elysia crispata TaxID=231223 RepID=A0AAE1B1R0_9GAST|nr:hypothetical protein RRG08_019657 [Elysia crispata]
MQARGEDPCVQQSARPQLVAGTVHYSRPSLLTDSARLTADSRSLMPPTSHSDSQRIKLVNLKDGGDHTPGSYHPE